MTGYAKAAIVTASLAAALAVTSCSDGADAEPNPTSAGSSGSASSSSSMTSTSSSSSATSSSTATVNVPAAARAHTEEGAKAFARFYHEAASQAYVTNDPSPIEALSDPSCKGCAVIINGVREQAKSGEHPASRRFAFESANVQPRVDGKPFVVDVLGTDKAVDVVDRHGKKLRRVSAVRSWTRVTLSPRGGGWVVQQLAAVKTK